MNPTGHPTPQELINVFKKTGLNVPFSSAMTKQTATREALANDPTIKGKRDEYKSKIDRLAKIDEQVRGMFGEGSRFAIENPMARERIAGQRHSAGLKDAEISLKQASMREDEIREQVDMIFDLHSELVREAEEEAKAVAKAAKSTKGTTKKTSTGKGTAQKLKEYADIDLAERVGIYDPFAQQVFLTSPLAFQKWWLREFLAGLKPPRDGYTKEEVELGLSNYNYLIAAQKEKTKAPTSSSTSKSFRF